MPDDLSHLSMDQEGDELEAMITMMALAGLAVFAAVVGLSLFLDLV